MKIIKFFAETFQTASEWGSISQRPPCRLQDDVDDENISQFNSQPPKSNKPNISGVSPQKVSISKQWGLMES